MLPVLEGNVNVMRDLKAIPIRNAVKSLNLVSLRANFSEWVQLEELACNLILRVSSGVLWVPLSWAYSLSSLCFELWVVTKEAFTCCDLFFTHSRRSVFWSPLWWRCLLFEWLLLLQSRIWRRSKCGMSSHFNNWYVLCREPLSFASLVVRSFAYALQKWIIRLLVLWILKIFLLKNIWFLNQIYQIDWTELVYQIVDFES